MKIKTVIIIGVSLVVIIAIVISFVVMREKEPRLKTISRYMNITVEDARAMIMNNEVSLIIDVRTREEYVQGHIPGAINIPLHELEVRISELEVYKNKTILVYCRSGRRSAVASEILVRNGFTKVYNMLGGIISWIEAGYPVEKPLLTVN